MTKNIIAILLIVTFMSSCCEDSKNNNEENQEAQETTLTSAPILAIGEFDAKAGEYVDQEIQVSGIVDHLCKHGGKRLFMVSDDGDLHIESEERFDDKLAGMEITVTGIVREFRVDEGYCLQMEEDNIQSHSEGLTKDDLFEQKMKQIEFYRDSMNVAEIDHISYYSLDYVSHVEKK